MRAASSRYLLKSSGSMRSDIRVMARGLPGEEMYWGVGGERGERGLDKGE